MNCQAGAGLPDKLFFKTICLLAVCGSLGYFYQFFPFLSSWHMVDQHSNSSKHRMSNEKSKSTTFCEICASLPETY